MRRILSHRSAYLALTLLIAGSGWASSSGQAAAPAFCHAGAGERLAAVRRVATCDECRTSGRRAGYKQCCEQVGGDYVCQWVRC